jgi:hypothetical protein
MAHTAARRLWYRRVCTWSARVASSLPARGRRDMRVDPRIFWDLPSPPSAATASVSAPRTPPPSPRDPLAPPPTSSAGVDDEEEAEEAEVE